MMSRTLRIVALGAPGARAGRFAHRGLVLAVSLALFLGCGSGDGPTGNDSEADSSALPEELVGTWRLTQIGDQYCDPATNQCTASYARRETVTLTADGRFEHVMYAESNFPPCSMIIAFQAEGAATAQGSTLTLQATTGRLSKQDNCGESLDEDQKGSSWTYTWEITAGSGTPQLYLTNSEGERIGPYDRQ